MQTTFTSKTLDNGLTVKLHQNPHLHSVCLGLFVRKDLEEVPGIAHLVEHMCYHNLTGLTQQELYHHLDCLGTNLDGVTSADYIRFGLAVCPPYFAEALALIVGLLSPQVWTAEMVRLEKEVVLRQIESKGEFWYLYREEENRYFRGTHYAAPVMGYASHVRKMTVRQINAYRARCFQPRNCCVTLTGALSDAQVEAALQALGSLENSLPQGLPDLPVLRVAQFGARTAASDMILKTVFRTSNVRLSFDVDQAKVNPYVAEILYNILGYGVPSRLSLRLRENLGLTDEIDGYCGAQRLIFDFEVDNRWLPEALEEAMAVLQAARTDICERDLRANIVFYTENQANYLDDPEDLGQMLGYRDFINGEGIGSIADLQAKYCGIRVEDLRAAARQILRPENLIMMVSNASNIYSRGKLCRVFADCRKVLEG